jgi:hypothetical protein
LKAFANKQNNVIMIKTTCIGCLVFCLVLLFTVDSFAQGLLDIGEKPASDSLAVTSLRSKNAISFGAGIALLNSDFSASDYENFIALQFKQFVTSKLAISGNLKKFDIENYDFKDNGFFSGDLNAEWYLFPNKEITPYFYAGPGLLISNDFEGKNYKVQGGVGLDFLINDWISVVGSLEVNYIYDVQNGSQLLQEAGGLYYNANVGILFYFGKGTSPNKKVAKKEKTGKQESSIIESNWIGRTKLK